HHHHPAGYQPGLLPMGLFLRHRLLLILSTKISPKSCILYHSAATSTSPNMLLMLPITRNTNGSLNMVLQSYGMRSLAKHISGISRHG
ncbi:hypothetical protein PtrEW13061_012009, partial [Pyrenophora tritici-repentis]